MSTLIVLDKLVQIAVLLLGGLFFRFNLFLLLLSFSSSFSIVNINLVEIWRERKGHIGYIIKKRISKKILGKIILSDRLKFIILQNYHTILFNFSILQRRG